MAWVSHGSCALDRGPDEPSPFHGKDGTRSLHRGEEPLIGCFFHKDDEMEKILSYTQWQNICQDGVSWMPYWEVVLDQ